MNDDFFALPAFQPEQALLNLKRGLRDLRSLGERAPGRYELQGQVVLELSADAQLLHARLARKPSRSPEWDARSCKNATEVRALQDEIKRRLARWTDETP